MKIKFDFITNSSSTSYVMILPNINIEDHMKITEKIGTHSTLVDGWALADFDEFYFEHIHLGKEERIKFLLNELRTSIEKIQQKGQVEEIWETERNISSPLYSVLINFFTEMKLQVCAYDSQPSEGKIIVIPEDVFKNILKEFN